MFRAIMTKQITALALLLGWAFMVTACSTEPDEPDETREPGDPAIFAQYPDLDDPYHILEPVDYEGMMELIGSEEVNIVYFGWATCPWCAMYVPYFDRVGRRKGIDVIYKFDIRETRVVIEDGATGEFSLHPDFQAIVDVLGPENLPTTTRPAGCDGEACQELPWFTVPALFVLENRQILASHIGALPGHSRVDGDLPPLDAEQAAALEASLEVLFQTALDARN